MIRKCKKVVKISVNKNLRIKRDFRLKLCKNEGAAKLKIYEINYRDAIHRCLVNVATA